MNKIKTVLDTNMLYYWIGLSTTNFDRGKIAAEIQGRNGVFISQISLVEILTNDDLADEQKIRVFEFLCQNKLPVLPISATQKNLIPPHTLQLLNTPVRTRLLENIATYRQTLESGLAAFLVESLVGVLSIVLQEKSGLTSNQQKHNYAVQMEALILGNRPFIRSQCNLYVATFYHHQSDAKFKEDIEGLALSLLYCTAITHNAASHEKFVSEFAEGPEQMPQEDIDKLNETLASNPIFNGIHRRLSGKPARNILRVHDDGAAIEEALRKYGEEMKISVSFGTVEYFMALMRKVLVDGKGIEKNDLIDSQIAAYYPDLQILSADKGMRRILEIVSLPYYQANEDFLLAIGS